MIAKLIKVVLGIVVIAGLGYLAFERMQETGPDPVGTVLITGSNRGIGLEFATQYAARGWTVIATHRRMTTPESLAALQAQYPAVHPERLDVLDHASIDALARKLQGTPIDVLINNAAIMGTGDPASAQSFGSLKHALFERYMKTNALGPLKVAEAFMDHVAASQQRKIINISSSSGAVTDPRAHSERLWYRSSKATLNSLMVFSVPAARKRGVSITLFEPGWTWTGQDETRRDPEQLDPSVVVTAMIDTIADITLEDSGQFIRRHGDEQPW